MDFSISNHTEHTLSENTVLFAGVNKNLKCNIGFVCESRMLSIPPNSLKKGGLGGWKVQVLREFRGTGSQSVTTVTSRYSARDFVSGKIRTRANFKPLTPCSDSTMPVCTFASTQPSRDR